MSRSFDADFESNDASEAVDGLRHYLVSVTASVDNDLLCSAVLELVRNVNEWSGSAGNIGGIVDEGELVLTVRDSGVGIHHNLNSDFGIGSAVEAAERAFEEGITSSGDPLRGRGLAFCLSLTERSGSILLETDGASVSGWYGEVQSVSTSRGVPRGTSVTMRFPIHML